MKKGAIEAYKKAEEASKDLKAYNSVKLGLALNYSVFQYEVMKQPEKACRISQKALEEALEVIDECNQADI